MSRSSIRRESGEEGGGKKEEKSEEEEKESDSKVGRSARFRRARRAGHSSILASRADGLSLPLPLRPSSSSSFSSGKLSALSLSLSLSERPRAREERFLLGSFGFSRPSAPTTLAQRLSTTLNSKVLLSLPPRPITEPAHRCLTRETFSGY